MQMSAKKPNLQRVDIQPEKAFASITLGDYDDLTKKKTFLYGTKTRERLLVYN